jgi:hypothetical protein
MVDRPSTRREEPPLSARPHLHRAVRRAFLMLAAGGLWAVAVSGAIGVDSARAEADEAPGNRRLYDAGLQFGPADLGDGALPLELAIDYFAAGSPPVRWGTSRAVVAICTYHVGRPASVTAEQFREAVRLGAEMWNNAEAAVAYDYQGDCTGTNWADGNLINEIGWDDSRNQVQGAAAASTQGTWVVMPGSREFREIDIVVDHLINVPEVCFRSVMAHELGHGLGLGHSDARADLMYPSFNPDDVSTCPGTASAAEIARIVEMYGMNRRPSIAEPAPVTAAAGAQVTLAVEASDPEGDVLSYVWTQTGGTPVAFIATSPAISFATPNTPGEVLTFAVAVSDRFLRPATSTVTLTIDAAPPTVGTFIGEFPSKGLALVVWGGGEIGAALNAAADQGAGGLFVTRDGRFIGYTIGAPSFVNASFLATYAEGDIPAGTPMLVVVYN